MWARGTALLEVSSDRAGAEDPAGANEAPGDGRRGLEVDPTAWALGSGSLPATPAPALFLDDLDAVSDSGHAA